MKLKHFVTIVVTAVLVVFGFFMVKSCRVDKEYKALKKSYEQYRSDTEARITALVEDIGRMTEEVAKRDKTIGEIESQIVEKDKKLKDAKNIIWALQHSEPVQPELEHEPLVINLRQQVSGLTKMYNLSQETVALQTKEIEELKGKCSLLGEIGDKWREAYEREHTLRVQAEALFKKCEQSAGLNRPWKSIATVAVAVAGAGVIYGILK